MNAYRGLRGNTSFWIKSPCLASSVSCRRTIQTWYSHDVRCLLKGHFLLPGLPVQRWCSAFRENGTGMVRDAVMKIGTPQRADTPDG